RRQNLVLGTCKSLTELEYFCEEVYKATTEKLDWINPEGRQYPHDLRQPLPLAQQDPRESFDELTDSTFDFSAFVLNRLNVQTLTPELLAGPTFELMKGTCRSLTELEYFCEEVYKATTEKLDWINPEGRQYPHDLQIRQIRPLGIQDIEDMLLLLVQGKVTNLSVEERIAFNVSLRMFTRRVVIQRRVEDLQLGVETDQI
ncbi:hypothetical protein Tco_0048238, partial [Tanacetum coccineum]